MARYFREQDIDVFRECFYLFARSGKIRTVEELTVIMRSLEMSPTITELKKYYKDKGGQISFADFLDIMHTHTKRENIPQEILNAFRACDPSNRGVISVRDLKHIIQAWGEKLSPREGAECHKEWRKIREKYVKEKSKLKGKSGDEAKLRQKWPMYDCLFFLNPFISSRKCIGTQEDTQTATELLASMQQPINSGHENSNEELLSEQLETMNEDLYEDIPLVHSAASPPIIVSQFMASIPPVHQQITTSSRSTTPSSVTTERFYHEAKIPQSGQVKYESLMEIICAPAPDYY